MINNDNCPFCEILKNTDNTLFVCDFSYTFVVMDDRPLTKGHLMVLPKSCIKDLRLADINELMVLTQATKYLTDVIDSIYSPERVGMFTSGFHDIDHLHIHMLPLFDKFKDLFQKDRHYDIEGAQMERNVIKEYIENNPPNKSFKF